MDPKSDINLEEKMKPFDAQRKFLVLRFFLGHFITMAEKSNQFRHKGQSYLYVQMSDIILKRIEVMFSPIYDLSAYFLCNTSLTLVFRSFNSTLIMNKEES